MVRCFLPNMWRTQLHLSRPARRAVFFYTWDVMLFGYLTVHEESVLYLSIMIGGWLLLELFGLSLPLVRMKPKLTGPDSGNSK